MTTLKYDKILTVIDNMAHAVIDHNHLERILGGPLPERAVSILHALSANKDGLYLPGLVRHVSGTLSEDEYQKARRLIGAVVFDLKDIGLVRTESTPLGVKFVNTERANAVVELIERMRD